MTRRAGGQPSTRPGWNTALRARLPRTRLSSLTTSTPAGVFVIDPLDPHPARASTQTAETIARMREGFAAWEATGADVLRPYYLALLADVTARAGEVREALRLIDMAAVAADKSGERSWLAEVHRLQGELLLQEASGEGGRSVAVTLRGGPLRSYRRADLRGRSNHADDIPTAVLRISSARSNAGRLDLGTNNRLELTGMEHSPTSGTGTGWERTPWHAAQRAAWEAHRNQVSRKSESPRSGARSRRRPLLENVVQCLLEDESNMPDEIARNRNRRLAEVDCHTRLIRSSTRTRSSPSLRPCLSQPPRARKTSTERT